MTDFFRLLDSSAQPPEGYVTDVAQAKRFLERYVGDSGFRRELESDPESTLAGAGLLETISLSDLPVFLDARTREGTIAAFFQGQDLGAVGTPDCVTRFCAYTAEKLRLREKIRKDAIPSDSQLAAWRERQVNRCSMLFGAGRSSALVHSPLAIELTKGCTVGCWFCGLAAPAYSGVFLHDDSNAVLWRECLEVLRAKLGLASAQGVLYWATEPFDNPDYELFMEDFWSVMGRWPQTTTAAATRDIERTRRFLDDARRHDSEVDRFSILSVGQLRKVHDSFSAESLLSVECLTQNRESGIPKARAGRAATVAGSRRNLVVDEECVSASSIACVSGFLLNMVDKTVKMISPCASDENWPLGYWVVDEQSFVGASSLDSALSRMIEEHSKPELPSNGELKLRSDVHVASVESSDVLVISNSTTRMEIACRGFTSRDLADVFSSGSHTLRTLPAVFGDDSQLLAMVGTLRRMYRQGLLDEDPVRAA